MNTIVRQRIPLSVRRLLTDLRPKEDHHSSQWVDAEPEGVARDGIQVPSRGAGTREEFLTPADSGRDERGTAGGGSDARGGAVCGLCRSEPSRYTCPRCNLPYCGLTCYRSPDHSACSEEFYKESVLRELKDMGQTEAAGRRKMQDILLGLRQKASRMEGGMESVLRELEEEEEEEGMKGGAEVLELLSRLAELQQTGEEKEEEIEAILRRLEEIGGGELSGSDVDNGDAEGGDEPGLAERLAGLDIDTLPEEALWDLLDSQEKERFMGLVSSGTVGTLVPLWRPWWEEHEVEEEEEGGRALVEVLEEEVKGMEGEDRGIEEERRGGTCVTAGCDKTLADNDEETQGSGRSSTGSQGGSRKEAGQEASTRSRGGSRKEAGQEASLSTVPPISVKIPKLSSLSSRPSPLVCHGLVNALFGYAFSLSLINGDVESATVEFCDTILAASEALNSGMVFSSLREALERGEAALLATGHLDREDPCAAARTVEAVAHILTGRSRREAAGYCLAALSQLRSSLSRARAALPKGAGGEEARRKYFLAGKKCQFYQAWVCDNHGQMRRLAAGLWKERSRRECEWISLERDKRLVEERRKTERKGKGLLIQELS